MRLLRIDDCHCCDYCCRIKIEEVYEDYLLVCKKVGRFITDYDRWQENSKDETIPVWCPLPKDPASEDKCG